MLLKIACEQAVECGCKTICQTDSPDVRLHVDESGPLYFIDEEYVKIHKHPPYWNPTYKEITATNWVVCDENPSK